MAGTIKNVTAGPIIRQSLLIIGQKYNKLRNILFCKRCFTSFY